MSASAAALRVRHHGLHFFVREALKRVRLAPGLASHTADALVAANLRGADADGVGWLPDLVTGLSTRHLNPAPEMRVVSASGGVAVLDGDNGLGPVVAHRAMTEAVTLAGANGVGAVAVRRSNRPGALDHFAALALPERLAGVALTNRIPDSGEGGAAPAFSPVEIAFAVPLAETAPPLLLHLRLSSNPAGEEEVGAADAERDLTLALETLVLLGGGALAPELAAEPRPEPVHRGVGQLFLAFRVRAFAPWAGFRNRMVERLEQLRRARVPAPGQDAAAIEEQRRTFGIPLDQESRDRLARLANGLGLGPEWESLVRSGRPA